LVDSSSDEFQQLSRYLAVARGLAHEWQSDVAISIFRVNRKVEGERWLAGGSSDIFLSSSTDIAPGEGIARATGGYCGMYYS